MRMQCRQVNISELCVVERAVNGKIFRRGTCFVKLSAVDEFVGQITEPGKIDSRYAAMEPKSNNINTDYLYIAISRKFPEFLSRYRTTINLQADTLKYFTIDWHDDKDAQSYIAESINTLDKEVEAIEHQIDLEKEMKRWYLEKMIVT